MFLSKKKNLVHCAFDKPLISYPPFDDTFSLVSSRWRDFLSYEMLYPKLNLSMRWKNDYIFLQRKKMQREQILEEMMSDAILHDIQKKLSTHSFVTNITESKDGSFYLIIKIKTL